MTNQGRFISVCRKLWNRYYDPKIRGVTVSVGGKPTKYRRLEDLAAVKYLGCDPAKLKP